MRTVPHGQLQRLQAAFFSGLLWAQGAATFILRVSGSHGLGLGGLAIQIDPRVIPWSYRHTGFSTLEYLGKSSEYHLQAFNANILFKG